MTHGNRERNGLSAWVSALRESRNANDLSRAHGASKFDQDSYTRAGDQGKLRGSYVTPNRAQTIVRSLNDRDCKVVEILVVVQLASGAQIRHLVWGEGTSAARQARRQMVKLSDLRVVSRQDQRVGGVRSGLEGYAYSLDIVGQLMTGLTTRRRRPRSIGLPFVAHAMAVTDCYIALKVLEDRGVIELTHFEAEPSCWREFSGPGGARLTLKPDAFVISAQGDFEDRWYLEIDRSTESPSRLLKKAETYVTYYRSGREQAANDVFPRVLWVVPDARRASQLIETLGKLPADYWTLFQVTTTNQFTAAITAGAGDGGSAT